ncbi:hypothetical protein Tco_1556927 [Tanacetum coccineum]
MPVSVSRANGEILTLVYSSRLVIPTQSSRSDFVITRKKLIHNRIDESKKIDFKEPSPYKMVQLELRTWCIESCNSGKVIRWCSEINLLLIALIAVSGSHAQRGTHIDGALFPFEFTIQVMDSPEYVSFNSDVFSAATSALFSPQDEPHHEDIIVLIS